MDEATSEAPLGQPVPLAPAPDVMDVPPEAIQTAKRPRRRTLATQQPREVVASASGVDIMLDVHKEPGQPGHYRRVVVRCPCHVEEGRPPCSRTRNWGTSQTAYLGHMEPVAALAIWLNSTPQFTSRGTHMKYYPTSEDIKATMEERGWLAGQPMADA